MYSGTLLVVIVSLSVQGATSSCDQATWDACNTAMADSGAQPDVCVRTQTMLDCSSPTCTGCTIGNTMGSRKANIDNYVQYACNAQQGGCTNTFCADNAALPCRWNPSTPTPTPSPSPTPTPTPSTATSSAFLQSPLQAACLAIL